MSHVINNVITSTVWSLQEKLMSNLGLLSVFIAWSVLVNMICWYHLYNICRGTCKSGVCKPFCTAKDLTPCKCSKVEDACKICCKGLGQNSICTPYVSNDTGSTINILDGRSCQGEEQQGICVQVTSLVPLLTVSSFWRWQKWPFNLPTLKGV